MARETIDITDHGRVLQVPASRAVVNFTCKGCNLVFGSHLFQGETIKESFGKCPRCDGQGSVLDISMDFDKIIEMLQEQGKVKIIWQ
jgi:peptide subunit release factor 1 (eRF1)